MTRRFPNRLSYRAAIASEAIKEQSETIVCLESLFAGVLSIIIITFYLMVPESMRSIIFGSVQNSSGLDH